MKLSEPSSYIRFLACLNHLDRVGSKKSLDSIEKQLLNRITLAALKDDSLLVGDLIGLRELGATATIHGRVKNLVAMGYIKLTVDKADERRKLATPTAKGMQYYDELAARLKKALAD
jgi:DNA-binding MarR family transcriptional regulator